MFILLLYVLNEHACKHIAIFVDYMHTNIWSYIYTFLSMGIDDYNTYILVCMFSIKYTCVAMWLLHISKSTSFQDAISAYRSSLMISFNYL